MASHKCSENTNNYFPGSAYALCLAAYPILKQLLPRACGMPGHFRVRRERSMAEELHYGNGDIWLQLLFLGEERAVYTGHQMSA